MAWKTETKRKGKSREIYRWNDEDKKGTYALAAKITTSSKTVEIFPGDWWPTKSVVFDGYREIPSTFVNDLGWFRSKAPSNNLSRILKNVGATELIISKTKKTQARKVGQGIRFTFNEKEYSEFVDKIRTNATALRIELQEIAEAEMHSNFPSKCKAPTEATGKRLSRLLGSLDKTVIPKMSADDIGQLANFTADVVNDRYVHASHRRKLAKSTKFKFDELALTQVIDEFEKLLTTNPLEGEWGKFLRRNLHLLESRYVHVLEKLNVVTASAREPDFGLVDTHGYLDIFEIKRPTTRLLSKSKDRGNHYWHSDATKAITQAEKYHYNAEQRAATLEKDIKRELKTEVKITRPRVVLIMGSSTQLTTDEEREDLRVLRQSLKNVEVVLYDELLDRLKNQREKIV